MRAKDNSRKVIILFVSCVCEPDPVECAMTSFQLTVLIRG
jgi:hypothetical protein